MFRARRILLAILCSLALLFVACTSNLTGNGDGGSGTDASTETDADTDPDAGADPDADTDPDAGSGHDPTVSEHALPVPLPSCDTGDPEVKIVDSAADFDDVNSSAYDVFCVEPGNYDVEIDLTANGTADDPRVLRYYDPGNPDEVPHPVHLDAGERATIRKLHINSNGESGKGEHWVVTGLHIDMDYATGANRVRGSGSAILDRLLIEHSGRNMLVLSGSDISLQNSVLRDTALVPQTDNHCVNGKPNDTRIVNNEIYNCAGDCFQAGKGTGPKNLLIADNHMYITSDIYVEGGEKACAENALDFKSGGAPGSANWVRVLGNVMWGFRKTADSCGGTGSAGNVIVAHYTAEYILFADNVMMDAPSCFSASKPEPDDVNNFSFIGNVCANMVDPYDGQSLGFSMGGGKIKASEAYFNVTVSTDLELPQQARTGYECNVAIDVADPANNSAAFDSAADSSNEELCVTIKKWTDPQTVCIDGGTLKPASLTPECADGVGEDSGLGVDDTVWLPSDLGPAGGNSHQYE